MPETTEAGRERVQVALRNGDGTGACPCGFARIVKRQVGASWTVTLQCEECGRSMGGSIKRAEFPKWNEFSEWNAELPQRWSAAFHERSVAHLKQYRDEREQKLRDHRRQYAKWCRESPEWAWLRHQVISRAGGICEACLSNPAVTAHHITYEFGVIPPAWHLRAVCRACHERLHADHLGLVDDWCPQTVRGDEKVSASVG
jgi:hypothetical protein